MRVRFLIAAFLLLGVVGNVQAQGERPTKPDKATKGGVTKPAPPLQPQCTDDATEKGLAMCYDWGQTQRDGMHACPANFAKAGGGNRNNHFYCVYVGPYTDSYLAEGATRLARFESMVCKPNYFATGLHEENYRLRCATTGAPVKSEAPQGLGNMTLCPGTVAGKQLAVVTGWNTLKGQAICAITAPAPALPKKK